MSNGLGGKDLGEVETVAGGTRGIMMRNEVGGRAMDHITWSLEGHGSTTLL